ncbi:PQQ-dependent sugar dehydrogenase [Shigella flexneri]
MNMARAVVMNDIPQKGKNYGWPLATWGINYSGSRYRKRKGEIVAETSNLFFTGKVRPLERHGLL